MSYLNTLKKEEISSSERWIVKYHHKGKHKIREVKSLFKPSEYKGSRPMYNDKQIIEILTKEL